MYEDERMLKRLFATLGMIMSFIVATLYVPDQRFVAAFALVMTAGVFWNTTNYLRLLDRGR